jgi:hypothetical protein
MRLAVARRARAVTRVFERLGWTVSRAGAGVDLAVGAAAAQLGPQLSGAPRSAPRGWPMAATRARVAQRRVVSSTRRASR